MTFVSGKWNVSQVLFRALLNAALLESSLSLAAAPAGAMVATEEICMRQGTYPMIGGGTTAFSHDKTCFSRPATDAYSWEKKSARVEKGAPDPFNGARIVQYDYHDALYHCAKRHLRLPTVEELKALFAYANAGSSTDEGSKYAIVAPKDDSRYPGGVYGWGGGSTYWSNTFAGKGFRKVVNLGDGRVSIHHGSQRGYVSCVR